MSVLELGPRYAEVRASRLVPRVLAAHEGRRLLLHPVMLLGFAMLFLAAGGELVAEGGGPRQAFSLVDSAVTFFPGVFAILAAHLVASRDERAGGEDLLDPLPGQREDRVLGLCLGSLLPALVAQALVLVAHVALLGLGRYEVVPGVWHLVQAPVTVLGACLLGTMIATWLPARSVAVMSVLVVVAVNVYLVSDPADDRALLGLMVSCAAWGDDADRWGGVIAGSPAWHVIYLLGLCGLAAAGAWFRVARRRLVPLAFGLVALAVAVTGAVVQLP